MSDCGCNDKQNVYFDPTPSVPVTGDCDCTADGKTRQPLNLVVQKSVDTMRDGRRYHCTLVFVKDHHATFYIDADGVEHLITQYDLYEDDHQAKVNKYFGTPVYDLKNHILYKYTVDGKPLKILFEEVA